METEEKTVKNCSLKEIVNFEADIVNESEIEHEILRSIENDADKTICYPDKDLEKVLQEEQKFRRIDDFLTPQFPQNLTKINQIKKVKSILNKNQRNLKTAMSIQSKMPRSNLQSKVYKSDKLAIKKRLLQALLGQCKEMKIEKQTEDENIRLSKTFDQDLYEFKAKDSLNFVKRKRELERLDVLKEDEVIEKLRVKKKIKITVDHICDDSDISTYLKRLKQFILREKWWKVKLQSNLKPGLSEVIKILNEEPLLEDIEITHEYESLNKDDLLERIACLKRSKFFNAPLSLFSKLYTHQKEGVEWLLKSYQRNCGGILGDEQGLGKTCQISSFLGILKLRKLDLFFRKQHQSTAVEPNKSHSALKLDQIPSSGKNKRKAKQTVDPFAVKTKVKRNEKIKPRKKVKVVVTRRQKQSGLRKLSTKCYFLIVCPATTISLWLEEIRTWAPWLRVYIMHNTSPKFNSVFKTLSACKRHGDVVITTYGTLRLESTKDILFTSFYSDLASFDAIVLDEGHKLKNPLTESSTLVRELRCSHKFIVTGTPLQNGLSELWTLIDLVKPGLLGTYAMFEKQFERVIKQGGTKSASKGLVYLAYRCAMILKQTVKPYLLRRMKQELLQKQNKESDENGFGLKLPKKSEHIVFCKLSSTQVSLYSEFLEQPELKNFLQYSQFKSKSRKPVSFRFIKPLQHICNHPQIYHQLTLEKELAAHSDEASNNRLQAYGKSLGSVEQLIKESGKLKILSELLKSWQDTNKKRESNLNKVLLFSQSRKMLDIFEYFVVKLGYKYLRMDGNSSVKIRQGLIDKFNNEEDIFIFLLTTRVGGVGINLTGANKVIIYDPDWNPTTDTQARERAYRLGQTRDVKVLRFITKGTIEEKIYERQVFKQYLTNKVLHDPRQKGISALTKGKGLQELFTLTGYHDQVFQSDQRIRSKRLRTDRNKNKRRLRGHQLEENSEDEVIVERNRDSEEQISKDGISDAFENILSTQRVKEISGNSVEDETLKREAETAALKAKHELDKSSKLQQNHFLGSSSSALLNSFKF